MKSRDAAQLLGNGVADAVFIDGAHDAASVQSDVLLYNLILRPDALLCGHDVGNGGVSQGLREAKISYKKAGAGSIWVRT